MFLTSCTYRVRDAIRQGDKDALQKEIEFCEDWGGPLKLVALVARVHLEQVPAPAAAKVAKVARTDLQKDLGL